MMPRTPIATVLLALLVAACSGFGTSEGTSTLPATSTSTGAIEIGSELDPGTYTSTVFATPVTFTVPAGWKVFEDEAGQFGLARISNDGPPLLVLRDVHPAAAECVFGPEEGVGSGSEEFAQWLSGHEGLVATDPIVASVGGLGGYSVDIELDPAWTEACLPGAPAAVSTLIGGDISQDLFWGIDATEHQRYWFLDLPGADGGNIVIMADVCCGVDPADQFAAVREVVDSMVFDTERS